MTASKETGIDIEIDKLTRSIENRITGDSFPTNITLISTKDWKNITKKNGWVFDWKAEVSQKYREIYKLTIINNPSVIQGLVSVEIKEDHVFLHLIENAPFNKGKEKMYLGVAGNLVAFTCKLSFQRGHEGNVSFISKTQLIDHYVKTLGAFHFGGRIMIIDTKAAIKLINRYFNDE